MRGGCSSSDIHDCDGRGYDDEQGRRESSHHHARSYIPRVLVDAAAAPPHASLCPGIASLYFHIRSNRPRFVGAVDAAAASHYSHDVAIHYTDEIAAAQLAGCLQESAPNTFCSVKLSSGTPPCHLDTSRLTSMAQDSRPANPTVLQVSNCECRIAQPVPHLRC